MKSMMPLRSRVRWPIDLWSDDDGMRMPSRFARFISDVDDEFQTLAEWKPAVDVQETDSEYVVTADLPGVEPKDIEVSMDRGVLTVSGERKTESRDEKNGYRRVERFEGSFFRRLQLRDAADDADVSATAKQGVVEIRVPKAQGSRGRRISVKEAS